MERRPNPPDNSVSRRIEYVKITGCPSDATTHLVVGSTGAKVFGAGQEKRFIRRKLYLTIDTDIDELGAAAASLSSVSGLLFCPVLAVLELNPIEVVRFGIKTILRKPKARIQEALELVIHQALRLVTDNSAKG